MTRIDWTRYKAVLFDLDGVLTDTASIHSRAWKATFDDLLKRRAKAEGGDFDPFTIEGDYRTYVDGRPRYQGVDQFLRSRGIELPWGSAEDDPGQKSICGIGNRKNQLVGRLLREEGADVYPGTLALLKALQRMGMPMAVVTSSANADTVLAAAGVVEFFEAKVDGEVAARLGLRGKPHPDPFTEAARRLESDPAKTVVIEDAISGVQAGKSGGFGLVIGVDRHGDAQALLAAGADLVVTDLGELVRADG
ncbi:MAG: HAD family hydrolase [Acidimicrobiia bacterium]